MGGREGGQVCPPPLMPHFPSSLGVDIKLSIPTYYFARLKYENIVYSHLLLCSTVHPKRIRRFPDGSVSSEGGPTYHRIGDYLDNEESDTCSLAYVPETITT